MSSDSVSVVEVPVSMYTVVWGNGVGVVNIMVPVTVMSSDSVSVVEVPVSVKTVVWGNSVGMMEVSVVGSVVWSG